MAKGRFIVIYGINNIGKTTQAKMLVDFLRSQKIAAEYLKYPLYNLAPTGPLLNNYLRQGNSYQLSPREAQLIYTLNRSQFEPVLKEKLNQGITIVAEDYIGTGLAWGMAAGVSQKFLEEINSFLYKEDQAFLLQGKRYLQAEEAQHCHEKNKELLRRAEQAFLVLAKKNHWQIIKANNKTKEQVQKEIREKLKNLV